MTKDRIVAGASGSPGSVAAVRWAATEARLRDTGLSIIVAYHGRQAGRAATDDIIHTAVTAAREAAPGIEVRAVPLPGYAVPALLRAAQDAALLVVGGGVGGLIGRPAGSVAGQVATHARCSVVVVRGHPNDAGPVVVGVDDGADGVVGRAFDEAALRGAQVLAVTVGGKGGQAVEALGTELDSRLDPWRLKYPSVTARREYVDGRPDKIMVDVCRQARLAVVGPRRHGFEGVLLGAIGTRLLDYADCPVLIAR
jgi:nucleotide-binding universal stress UspA family protein